MDYKHLILTSGVVSDNQVSRRRGIILHARTVCVYYIILKGEIYKIVVCEVKFYLGSNVGSNR